MELSTLLGMKAVQNTSPLPFLSQLLLAPMDASDSPNNQMEAPSNTISFNKNCPGTTAKAGNPPKLGSQPGVENRKLSVVRNITNTSR